MRASSITNVNLAISSEISSEYDNVKIVADNIDSVITVASTDVNQLASDIESLMDFTDITVVGVASNMQPSWDSLTKILYIPEGDKGDRGDRGFTGLTGLTGATGSRGEKGDKGDNGSNGLDGLNGVPGAKGDIGLSGSNGLDGLSAYQQWVNEGNTGTVDDFLEALRGPRGAAGYGVDHIKYIGSLNAITELPTGPTEQGMFGNIDIFTMYADVAETIPLGTYKVANARAGSLSAADVKESYESNANTNAFTDQDVTDVSDNTLARHTHNNKAILDVINQNLSTTANVVFDSVNVTSPSTLSDYNITDVYTEAEVDSALSVKQATLVNQTNIKSINGDSILGSGNLEITVGSGGYAANVYLTTLTSSTNGAYKQVSYTPQAVETIVSATVNNNEVLLSSYIFDGDVKTAIIPAGEWGLHYHTKADSTVGITVLRFEFFKRSSGGIESTLFSVVTDEINSTVFDAGSILTTQQLFNTADTDRVGVKIYASTTRTSNVIVELIVGNGRAMYFTTPLEIRHNQLRARDEANAHPIGAIDGLQAALDTKANLVSPTFTGVPLTTTAAVGTNTTQIASTAFVVAEINKIEEW